MKLKAYAKINLSLKILGHRPDGYHEIESVMQSVSLCDIVSLEMIPSGIQLTTNSSQLTTNNCNLAYKAAEAYFRAQNTGIKIHIEKNIPIAAGLAGGAADAAAVLYGLNQLTINNCQLSINELMELGAQVGSDVPFCLTGGNCLVRGRGELITNYKLLTTNYYVLVVPNVEVSTKWAYEQYDRESLLLNPDRIGTASGCSNNLEPVVAARYPVVKEVKDRLIELGCSVAQMSGSGPSVFGIVADKAQGERIVQAMKPAYNFSFLVKSLDKGIDIV